MKGYQLTPRANIDLDPIWTYVAEGSGNAVADRLEETFHVAMQKLAEMPGIGHLREDLADEPLRFYNVRGYLIIYRPDTQPLQVIHVVHGARDIRAILGYRPRTAADDAAQEDAT